MGTMKNWSKGDWIKNGMTLLLPILVLLIPCTEAFDIKMKLFLASSLMAILCFALGTVNMTVVALILPVFWVVSGVTDAATAFGPWTNYVVWFILAGLVLAAVLERTGLLKRIAYFCLSFFGGSYRLLLIGIAVTSIICTLLIGDIVIPMAALCYGLCCALETGVSKTSAGIMLTGCFSVNLACLLKFTAPIIQIGVGAEVTGPVEMQGFFESIYAKWPLILLIALCIIVAFVIFKPEKPLNGTQYFKDELKKMGKLSSGEIKVGIMVIVYLAFIVTNGFNGMFSLEWGMIFIPMISLLPGVGVDGEKVVRELDYTFAIFVATCLGIGTVSVSLGVGDLLVNMLLPILEGASASFFLVVLFLICVAANVAMTPMAIVAAFTIPFVSLSQAMGINTLAVYEVMNLGIDQLFFPYESAMYLVFFAYGLVKMNDFMKMMTIKTVLALVVLVGVLLPWWGMIGFL